MQFKTFLVEVFPELKELKAENKKTAFNELMDELLPDVKLYIVRELARSLKNGSLPTGKYNVADFVDELYVLAYDHFNEVKEDKYLLSWLFKKADDLLEDAIVEEEFDHAFFKDIDSYSKLEWDEMEEKFSVDADGDMVAEEELDDLSLSKSNYILESVFVEDEQKDLIKKLDKELSKERIYNHIAMVLEHLPLQMRTIFDLAVNQQFNLEEISEIKKVSVQKVNQYLTEVRRHIGQTLENRYLSKESQLS